MSLKMECFATFMKHHEMLGSQEMSTHARLHTLKVLFQVSNLSLSYCFSRYKMLLWDGFCQILLIIFFILLLPFCLFAVVVLADFFFFPLCYLHFEL